MHSKNETKIFLIGVQARTDSIRFPRKAHAIIDDRPILHHVLQSCRIAAHYMGRHFNAFQALIKLWLLVPEGDELKGLYQKQFMVYEGDKDDVLSRYVAVANMEKADYIVRITGDCLNIPSFVISRAIKAAVKKRCDYTTNVIFRTAPEGFDVEVLSKRLLDYLDENAKGTDREHVTTLIRSHLSDFPFKLPDSKKPSICHLIDAYDLHFIKTSIDTEEEYKSACDRNVKYQEKIRLAEKWGTTVRP